MFASRWIDGESSGTSRSTSRASVQVARKSTSDRISCSRDATLSGDYAGGFEVGVVATRTT